MSNASDLRRDFASRQDLIEYVIEQFPMAADIDDHIPDTYGGRRAAEEQLQKIKPDTYARSRNFLDGDVTYLSPYIRHGILNLAEVRDFALDLVDKPQEAEKLVNELAWRDYFQKVYAEIGNGVWKDREPYKTGRDAQDYADKLPDDIRDGATGLKCMDSFAHDLHETGYLHNHARMWMASYVVHFRQVKWQAGAKWFLQHLLDGDPASNNMSWQWISSTYSNRPYILNRENLENYTHGQYCKECPLFGECDFEGTYDEIKERIFPPDFESRQYGTIQHRDKRRQDDRPAFEFEGANGAIWIHGDNLNPFQPALEKNPDAPAVFVFDDNLLKQWKLSLKRLVFLYESLLELPVTIRRGDVATQVAQFAQEHQTNVVTTMDSPSPRFAEIYEAIQHKGMSVSVLRERSLVKEDTNYDLKRFSRYWRKAKKYALR